MNSLFISGRLVTDPTVKVVGTYKVASLSIAVKDAGKKNTTSFFDVECWNKTAELVGANFVKGQTLSISGVLKQEKFKAKDGKEVSKVKVVANEILNLPSFAGQTADVGQSENGEGDYQF